MNLRRAQPSEVRAIMDWIAQGHYLENTPAGCVHALEFFEGRALIGAMLLGRPVGPGYADCILELTRCFFIDGTAHCAESKGLAMMRKHVRTWLQSIRLLIAYSDPEELHRGVIYQADGWAPLGMTKSHGKGWTSRDGRKAASGHPKQRWVRTP